MYRFQCMQPFKKPKVSFSFRIIKGRIEKMKKSCTLSVYLGIDCFIWKKNLAGGDFNYLKMTP